MIYPSIISAKLLKEAVLRKKETAQPSWDSIDRIGITLLRNGQFLVSEVAGHYFFEGKRLSPFSFKEYFLHSVPPHANLYINKPSYPDLDVYLGNWTGRVIVVDKDAPSNYLIGRWGMSDVRTELFFRALSYFTTNPACFPDSSGLNHVTYVQENSKYRALTGKDIVGDPAEYYLLTFAGSG